MIRALLIPALLSVVFAAGPACSVTGQSYGCCKICTVGKACGDSCINAAYTCHRGTGCACDASAQALGEH
jgi:hypothetical protein